MILLIVILILNLQYQRTPLEVACWNGNKEVVLVLLAHNAYVNAQNNVSDCSLGNNDFIDCHLLFLILYLFFIESMDPLTYCL